MLSLRVRYKRKRNYNVKYYTGVDEEVYAIMPEK
jgi:hypothetical protein